MRLLVLPSDNLTGIQRGQTRTIIGMAGQTKKKNGYFSIVASL